MKKSSAFSLEISENISYKIVALFIAIILWLTILNRREHQMDFDLKINFQTSATQRIIYQSSKELKLNILATRSDYRKLIEKYSFEDLKMDISHRGYGKIEVEIPMHLINLPNGIKLKQMMPSVVYLEVEEVSEENHK